ncbi:MAG: divalent-cation tolerance protein CutA [Acidobacteria bacterium]|nr:MAG: divalent-cation tolerance protein CutA [Acidobacteriota bacterium]REK03152.1 MAG: divalent-cation tolerance protein CutA [Acidobacteriota bacterium]REK15395.1 MAG: divalent-cation tolerance protein CutA [Acidobacteriota bacterium]REK42114.1 MAG: divalent-cation tolerance protein CutA [Acidobacteriota bacterium]
MLIVFTTAPDTKEAEKLAEAIVIQKLAACVQVLPKMTSFYSWKGAIEKDTEHLLLIKTDESKYAELEEWLLQNHSYEEPEIVAVQASEVSDGYRKWLTDYLGE